MIPFATTEHLLLRAYRESDRDLIHALVNDPRVARGIQPNFVVPRGPVDTKKFDEAVEKTLLLVVVEVKKEFLYMRSPDPEEVEDDVSDKERNERRKFVGLAMLDLLQPKNRDVTMGIMLGFPWWGKGFGTEILNWLLSHAFDQLGMRRMTLEVQEGNKRARELYEHIGFVEEGRKREAVFQDDGWIDMFTMGILDREWRAGKDKTNQAC